MRKVWSKYRRILLMTAAVVLFGVVCSPATVHAAESGDRKAIRIPCGINGLLTYDEDGNVTGYCKDYLDQLAVLNNWEYEYVRTSWPEAVEMLEEGQLDILFPTTWAQEREETMDFSAMNGGYMVSGLFARADSDYDYADYESFNGARIAITEGSTNNEDMAEFAGRYHFTYEPVYMDSTREKIRALNAGEVDMVIFSVANELPNAKLVGMLDPYPFYYTVKEGSSELLNELNNGMQQLVIKDPELVGETFGHCLTGTNGYQIAFTAQEREFIESNRKITVGFYQQTEPLAYINSEGEYSGIYVDLIRQAASDTGLNIELYPMNRDDNWKELLKSGTIDFYIGSSDIIAQKDADLISTDSFMEYKTVLVTQNDFNLEEREQITLALTNARSYWSDNLPSDLENSELIYYRTAKDCLLAVKQGEADATLLNTFEFNYQSKNSRFAELVQWENYRFASGVGMTGLKDMDPVMFSVMDKALTALTEAEVNDITNRNINMSYEMSGFGDYMYSTRNFWVILIVVIVILAAGGIVALHIRKKQNEQREMRRRQEKQRLRIMAALSYNYVAIYYVNLDEDSYTVVTTSDKFREEVADLVEQEQPYSEAIRQYTDTFVLPEYQETIAGICAADRLIQRFETDKDFTVRYQVNPNERHQDYFEMHFVDVSANPNEHIMVFGVQCVDETVREEMQQKEALQEAFESANRANHAKSDFLSRMSHDIRTPMNAIIGMTAIAASHIDDRERVQDALGKITSSSRHLLGLINEVLDMSKIESGKIELAEEEFNLSELLNNLLIMVQPQIRQHEHNLQVHIFDMEHEEVVGDSLRIQQVFVNIMGNAVKYTPDRGNLCLTVREKPINERMIGCYEFVFEDDGVGMSKEYMEHIFEPFSRAEDDRTSKVQGTGLGMAIAQNIVRMMNGDIRVESEEGKGSRFTVTIFLKLQDTRETDVTELSGLPVLVVDDDQISCEAICKMLDEIGMDSQWVLSGQEAVELVRTSHLEHRDFYAVILDWQMPGMDGVETARAIKKIAGSTVSVIILSAYDWSDIEMEARAAGVDLFLSKPIFKSGFTRLFRKLKDGEDPEPAKPELEEVIESDYSGKRLLLVEDNEINREIATEVLKMTGIEIEEAENGKIAVDKFSESEVGYYDIILMDVQMPVMNGYDATSAIRSLKRSDAMRVPILAMTANAFAEDVQAAKSSGMNEHLAKPLDFDKLTEALKKYLG